MGPTQLDTYGEVGNVGAGNAATALSMMLAATVHMDPPFAVSGGADLLREQLPEADAATAVLGTTGALSGRLLCIYPDAEAFGEILGAQGEMLDSAFAELANILAAKFVVSVQELTGIHGDITPPQVHRHETAEPTDLVHPAASDGPLTLLVAELRVLGMDRIVRIVFVPDDDGLARLAQVGVGRVDGTPEAAHHQE